jgi:hypothetical protein
MNATAVPSEVRPILDALVSRYGATDGTLLFNALAEGTHLRIPQLRAAYAGIETYLADRDCPTVSAVAALLFASGLIEGADRVEGFPLPLLARLIHVFTGLSLSPPRTIRAPDLPAKTLYEPERVNPRVLESRLSAELAKASTPSMGLAEGRGAAALFQGLFCSTIGEIGDARAIAATLDLFEARMGGTAEEQAYFRVLCCLARYFSTVRGVPFHRSLSTIHLALSEKSMPSKDLVFILYDFFNDDRYKARHLAVLFSLVISCVKAFYPGRKSLIPSIMSLQKSFIRISHAERSQYVKAVFKTFVANPLLDLGPWVEEGARIIRTHGDASESAKAYFEKESDLSKRIWREIDSGIHVASVSFRLQHFMNAIAERTVLLRITDTPIIADSAATYWTDGETIFVPTYVKYVDNRDENFMVLLHSVLHECAHIEFGSFLENTGRFKEVAGAVDALFPGDYQKNRAAVTRFAQRVRERLAQSGFPAAIRLREERMTPLIRLLFHCRFPYLLRSLWNVVEDSRVNRLLYAEYGGFAKEREKVDAIDFASVPAITTLDPLNRLLSAFVQRVWFARVKGDMDRKSLPYFERMIRHTEAFRALPASDTYDSVRTAAEILAIVLQFLTAEFPSLAAELLRVEELDFSSLGIVSNPRNANLPLELQWYGNDMRAQGIGRQEAGRGENEVKTRALESIREGNGIALGQFHPPRLSTPFLYPEWDSERSCYSEDHCALFQSATPPHEPGVTDALASMNPGFVASVRRAFMAMKPQTLAETRGLEDGHEVDFDLHFDNLMDLSTGHPMESNFYIFREKKERSVVSALVLDMSPSTRQAVQGMSIFQHQKYAAYVLAEALDSLGDRFGIYTYYDFGPPATLFFPIKELDDRYSHHHVETLQRFQPARNGWSRFAVGLRHLIRKLRETREKARIIFFITDGLPFYYEGPSGRTEEVTEYTVDGRTIHSSTPVRVREVFAKSDDYIRAELRKVREEAALAGVHLFCITLEESSVPFMQETFGSAFIFLPDVTHLPSRLAQIFRALAT